MGKRESCSLPVCREAAFSGRPVRICIAGSYENVDDHTLDWRTIDQTVLIYCAGGQGWVQAEGREQQRVAPGQLFLLPRMLPHRYGNGPGGWSIRWLHLEGEGMDWFYARLGGGRHDVLRLDAPEAGRALEGILHELRGQPDLGGQLYAEARLTELLCRLRPVGTSDAVERLLHLLEETDRFDLTLDDLARMAGCSKYYLIRQFRQRTGKTPMEALRQMRLRRACDLLGDRSRSIAEISEQLGYSNPYHFSAAFHRQFGLSPSRYRALL